MSKLEDLQRKIRKRVIRHIKESGEWADATQRSRPLRKELLNEISDLIDKALTDYEKTRGKYA